MANFFRKAALAAVIGCLGSVAHADVLTFEEFGPGLNWVTANSQGFTIGTNNASTTDWFHSSTATVDYMPHSGSVFLSTDPLVYVSGLFVDSQPITNPVDFKFDGAWFSGGDQVRYKLYNNGVLVYTSADSQVLTPAPSWVPSGYAGLVDAVVIVGPQKYFAMDDFTFNSPVPEAGTLALFAAGLLALGARVRRRAA